MTIEAVEAIGAGDRRRAVASLTLAFASDPVMRWGWADQERYLTYWPRVTDAFGGGAFDHGTAYGLEDCRAVALWLCPGVGPDGATALSLMRESMDDATFEDFSEIFEQMDEFHPPDNHWYLPFTGVDPTAQGRGLGATLLRHALTRCDADGLPAYLEATCPRNRDLYARHGFDVLGVIQAGTSPPLWPMLRQPTSSN